jgi:hypothetical protein
MKSIDTDIDPCDNFYKFTCGKYIKMNPVPVGKQFHTTFDDIHEDIRMIMKCKYQLHCVDFDHYCMHFYLHNVLAFVVSVDEFFYYTEQINMFT